MVEVARGADSTPGVTRPHIPIVTEEEPIEHEYQAILKPPVNGSEAMQAPQSDDSLDFVEAGSSGAHAPMSNEEVLVHQPPNGMCLDDDVLMVDEDGAVSMSSPKLNGNLVYGLGNPSTGLSQSDLSVSSSTGSNPGYSYGNQHSYTVESKGYQSSSPRFGDNADADGKSSAIHASEINDENHTKPIITAAIYKTDLSPTDVLNDSHADVDMDSIEEKESDEDQISVTEIPAPIEFETNANYQPSKVAHANGFATGLVTIPETNGKHHPEDINENEISESNEFDSLINLPPPPICDEIKHLNEITVIENGNMDSLPPPPPEVAAGVPDNS